MPGTGDLTAAKHFADNLLHVRNVRRAEFIRVVEVEDEDVGVLLPRPTPTACSRCAIQTGEQQVSPQYGWPRSRRVFRTAWQARGTGEDSSRRT